LATNELSAARVDLVLLWHMHQPDYRDAVDGSHRLPWVYLHAIKDYADMAAHLERHAGVRAVVNFVPVLLDQLDDYARQFAEGHVRDPLLEALRTPDFGAIGPVERARLFEQCFHGNHERMVAPYPQYRRLHDLYRFAGREDPPCHEYLSDAYLADLLTWFHLVWIGESERRSNPLYGRLMSKGLGFTPADRRELFDAIGAIVCRLCERYRALARDGRVELSTTPHAHPIAPLLIDFECARDSIPDAPLPADPCYPGGAERVQWHLRSAVGSHARRFGSEPHGLWPAEGAVSEPFLAEAASAGMRWAASSETVLASSLAASGLEMDADRGWLYRGWRLPSAPGLTLYFRDELLSDRIGFEFSKWHGRDAAANIVGELERIGAAAQGGRVPTVLIALDGENAWEYYPFNGYYFFEEFYGALERHGGIRTRTLSDCAADPDCPTSELPRLLAGSWVHGTLSTWIGSPEKNRAWELLCEAKRAFDEAMRGGALAGAAAEAARRQMAACEGSDWFWWLGPHNPAPAVRSFDELFRHNLRRLYEMIDRDPPAILEEPLCAGGGDPETGGVMRRAAPGA
jgi:alpha-amylase/alpha-mannosidase (GH57 family)